MLTLTNCSSYCHRLSKKTTRAITLNKVIAIWIRSYLPHLAWGDFISDTHSNKRSVPFF